MTQPTMTCDKCGLQRIVTKSPEATENWFKKYHKDCGKPVYLAGFGVMSQYVGQNK